MSEFQAGDIVRCIRNPAGVNDREGFLAVGGIYSVEEVLDLTSDYQNLKLTGSNYIWPAQWFERQPIAGEDELTSADINSFLLHAEALNDIVETIKSFHGKESEWDEYEQGYVDALKDFAYNSLGVHISVDTSPRVTLTPVGTK